jgi:leucyl aminopeptidase
MYAINGHKHLITLKAISPTDKLNDKNKKHNDIFEKDTSIYWIFDKKQYDGAIFWRCAIHFFEKLKKEINIDINSFLKLSDAKSQQGIITSLISASELFNEKAVFKTTKVNENINNFIITGHDDSLELSKSIVECETWTNKIITTPSNLLNSDDFENIIKNRFKEFGNKIKINVLNKTELQKRQMGLLLAVGQGSHHTNDPRLIVLEYKNATTEKIALIGKGIMFDTGGINLKPSNALKNMHADMSGAAICLGILYALIKANAKINLSVVIPLTSNEINDRSYHVNDILTSYDGKTIEITNTDAEGRLILADAITYAIKDEQASTVVTMATLTGAIVVALGDVFAGY